MGERRMPIDRRRATPCKGGWFYVNEGSVAVVASDGDGPPKEATVTRRQLKAALKCMRNRTSDRAGKP